MRGCHRVCVGEYTRSVCWGRCAAALVRLPTHTICLSRGCAAQLRVPAPNPAWIDEEDCGAIFFAAFDADMNSGGVPRGDTAPNPDTEMQCTGLWNVMMLDADGSLLGGAPGASVVTAPPTPYGRTASGNPACTYRTAWHAWECAGGRVDRHDLLWMENAGRDLHSLRICPMEVSEMTESEHETLSPAAPESLPYRQQVNCFIDNVRCVRAVWPLCRGWIGGSTPDDPVRCCTSCDAL